MKDKSIVLYNKIKCINSRLLCFQLHKKLDVYN
jgi:hypothetical protein